MHSLLPVPRGMERWTEMFSPFAWMDNMTRVFSPYDYGPFYSNPLAPILHDLPHPRFATASGPRFFVTTTNVRTGRVRIFSDNELTQDAILASACLPSRKTGCRARP